MSLLAGGKLHGALLNHLIDDEINMIRNVQLFTQPEEENALELVGTEYDGLVSRKRHKNQPASASQVWSLADHFVVMAIIKNYDPVTGRFVMLR